MRALIALALLGCQPPHWLPPPPPPDPRLARCTPPGETDIDDVTIDQRGVFFCVTAPARSCWHAMMMSDTELTPGPVWPHFEPPETPRATALLEDAQVKLCPPRGECRFVAPPSYGPEDRKARGIDRELMFAAVTDDLSRLAIGGPDRIDLFDVAANAPTGRIVPWRPLPGTNIGLRRVVLLDDLVLAFNDVSPVATAARVFDWNGKLTASIGGPDFDMADTAPASVNKDQWAFVGLDQPILLVENVRTGAIVRAFDLARALAPGWQPPAALNLAHVQTWGLRIALLMRAPRPGFASLELMNGSIHSLFVPSCVPGVTPSGR